MKKDETKENEINMKQINKIIKETAEQTANKAVEKLRNRNLIKKEMSYYRRVEILLYSYNNLIDAIKQKDEDIEHIEMNGLPEKSKSIVIYQSNGGNITSGDRYLELIEKYKAEKLETERDLIRIKNALDKIRNDPYFNIIHYKYLIEEENKIATDEGLAEILKKDRTTIGRNRARLMNKLITILFPGSIKDII